MVEFNAMCQSCQSGSWKMAKRMEIETIEASQEEVDSPKSQEDEPHS